MPLFSIRRTASVATFVLAAATTMLAAPAPAHATGTGVLSGAAWQDANRNGVRDAGEPGFAGRQINVFDSTGAYVANGTLHEATGDGEELLQAADVEQRLRRQRSIGLAHAVSASS